MQAMIEADVTNNYSPGIVLTFQDPDITRGFEEGDRWLSMMKPIDHAMDNENSSSKLEMIKYEANKLLPRGPDLKSMLCVLSKIIEEGSKLHQIIHDDEDETVIIENDWLLEEALDEFSQVTLLSDLSHDTSSYGSMEDTGDDTSSYDSMKDYDTSSYDSMKDYGCYDPDNRDDVEIHNMKSIDNRQRPSIVAFDSKSSNNHGRGGGQNVDSDDVNGNSNNGNAMELQKCLESMRTRDLRKLCTLRNIRHDKLERFLLIARLMERSIPESAILYLSTLREGTLKRGCCDAIQLNSKGFSKEQIITRIYTKIMQMDIDETAGRYLRKFPEKIQATINMMVGYPVP